MVEIKKIIDACPYCGAMEMKMHIGKSENAYRVACPSCSATGPRHEDISTAISLWNTVSKSWFSQSLTTHIPPAIEVSQETCDQLRLENDLLEKMICERLGSTGELERGGNSGELERAAGVAGGDGELERGVYPGELERGVYPRELERGVYPGELERGRDPGELERDIAGVELVRGIARDVGLDLTFELALDAAASELERGEGKGELERGVSPETFITSLKLLQIEKKLNEILSIISKK
jgi:hypothetical protein